MRGVDAHFDAARFDALPTFDFSSRVTLDLSSVLLPSSGGAAAAPALNLRACLRTTPVAGLDAHAIRGARGDIVAFKVPSTYVIQHAPLVSNAEISAAAALAASLADLAGCDSLRELFADSVLRKRRRKMNKHKHRKKRWRERMERKQQGR